MSTLTMIGLTLVIFTLKSVLYVWYDSIIPFRIYYSPYLHPNLTEFACFGMTYGLPTPPFSIYSTTQLSLYCTVRNDLHHFPYHRFCSRVGPGKGGFLCLVPWLYMHCILLLLFATCCFITLKGPFRNYTPSEQHALWSTFVWFYINNLILFNYYYYYYYYFIFIIIVFDR